MKDVDLSNLLNQRLQNCAGFGADDVRQARIDALNYYLQRARGDEVTGSSTVVAGDLSASVEANLAQMMDSFSSDNIVEFDALDAADEPGVKDESDAVTHFVMKAQNGYMELQASIKDALLLRNGIMKCWVDEFSQTRTRTFDKVAPEAVAELSREYEILSYSDETLKVRKTQVYKKFRAESVAPENFFYPLTHDSFDIQDIPFCAERHVSSRSDLIRMGLPKSVVNNLKPFGGGNAARPDGGARDPNAFVTTVTQSLDSSQDQIEWYECYHLNDVDGDGISERRRTYYCHSDATVIKDEPCALVPYAIGAALVMPHRLTGISQYDKLRQTQDEHTGLKRALYDNVNTVTKNRVAYLDGVVNADDLSDGRTNGAIRVRTNTGIADVRAAITAFQVPDNSANILQNIEALKRERTELGGAALELASGNLQIGGDRMGSQGLDRAYSVMEQLAALMTKTVAATLIRNLFLLAHATLRENFDQPVPIKRQGKWISPIPAKWPSRNRVTVKIGMSPGERARKAGALMTMLQSQTQLAGQGMDEVLVNVDGFYRTLMDWARVSDIQNPEQYWVDPSSDEAKKAFAAKNANAQASQQKREALMTQAIGLEQIRAAIQKYTADQKTQYDYWKGVLDSEVAEAQIVGKATADLLAARQLPNDAGSDAADDSGSEGTESESAPSPSVQ